MENLGNLGPRAVEADLCFLDHLDERYQKQGSNYKLVLVNTLKLIYTVYSIYCSPILGKHMLNHVELDLSLIYLW